MRPLLLTGLNYEAVDTLAWIIVIVGIVIVFISLIIIYLFFRYGMTAMLKIQLKNLARKKGIDPKELENSQALMTGETNAAIAMALYSYYDEIHDEESGVITIKRVSKMYSPWSSKLYNMKNLR